MASMQHASFAAARNASEYSEEGSSSGIAAEPLDSTPETSEGGEGQTITIFDPTNKKPYQLRYVPDSPETELYMTAGLELRLSESGNTKRPFLCKKYQARQCRAQATCNSIHADRKRVAALRAANPTDRQLPVEIQVQCPVEAETFAVPVERVHPSAGFDALCKALAGKAKLSEVGILCKEFEVHPCATDCRCIHVDVAYLRHVRSMWKMPCCSQSKSCCEGAEPLADDQHPCGPPTFRVGESGVKTPKALLAVTRGLYAIAGEAPRGAGVLTIPTLRVCRPHQKKACKWGSDCNNVHVCRSRQPASKAAKPATPPLKVFGDEAAAAPPAPLLGRAALPADLSAAGAAAPPAPYVPNYSSAAGSMGALLGPDVLRGFAAAGPPVADAGGAAFLSALAQHQQTLLLQQQL
eukprot:gene7690-11801_t